MANKIPDAAQQSSTAACASEELQSEDEAFNVSIATSGETMCFQVSWNDTVHTVKAMIQTKEYINRCDQVLKFSSIELEDRRALFFYDIMPGLVVG